MIAMLLLLLVWAFLLSPLVALGFFVAYLCFFISARRKNAHTPGTVPEEVVWGHKKAMILSGIVTVVLAAVCWTSILLFAMSLRFM